MYGIRELQWLQYFKMVFLEILNVLLRTVFTETVTFIDKQYITYAASQIVITDSLTCS